MASTSTGAAGAGSNATPDRPARPAAGAAAEQAPALRAGDPAFRRAVVGLVAAGLATFNAMYCTQALMPALTDDLHVNPAQAALTVSAATGLLAVTILPASVLSERFGRTRVIVLSALAAGLVGLLLPLAPSLPWLVGGRAVQGLLLAGVPATAMAWLAEEVDGRHLAPAMGQYVAGTTVGGLLGRLIPSGVLEVASWRWALGVSMTVAVGCAIVTSLVLPAQRRFTPKRLTIASETAAVLRHWRNPMLAGLFVLPFVEMGSFVSLYNFLGYRLIGTFGLSEAVAGGVFLLYLFGTFASAYGGRLAARIGRGRVLVGGAALALVSMPLAAVPSLPVLLVATAAFTTGFFATHSVASGWVGALARRDRAEASGMYLACYYLGSSVLGYVSGLVFHAGGWGALVAWLTATLTAGTLLGLAIARRAARG